MFAEYYVYFSQCMGMYLHSFVDMCACMNNMQIEFYLYLEFFYNIINISHSVWICICCISLSISMYVWLFKWTL